MTVDDRTGSEDLLPLLRKRGVPAELGRLEFGDISFIGNGPDEMPIAVGIEVKKVSDVLKCITDGRFAGHQLPGMIQCYQYAWLLMEGGIRPDMITGLLQSDGGKGYWHNASVGGRTFMYRDLDHWLMTMEIRGGIRIVKTKNRYETAQWLADLYHWWTDKEWEQHRSHLAPNDSGQPDTRMFIRPTVTRRIAAQLAGIGWDKAGKLAATFGTPADLLLATEADLQRVDGIGPKLAKSIVTEIQNG